MPYSEDSPAKVSDILKEALEDFKLCVDAEKDNREAALDDLKFARLAQQWPDDVKAKREAERRPCMTFNRMETFIRQVVNDGRMNKPSIKVHPADDKADPKTAEIINGLIRNIEYSSNSEVAYDTGLDAAASCGFGYWRVAVEYSHDDTFDMDISIEPIQNQFSVYGDWANVEADSAEWRRCFVMDSIELDDFNKKYKGKEPVSWESENYKDMPQDWCDGEKIVIAEYWTRKEVPGTLYLLSDGRAVRKEWFDEPIDGLPTELGEITNGQMLTQSGITIKDEREIKSWKVVQHILNGVEVLESNDWAGHYIPIVPIYGVSINVEGKRYLKSLIRDAKDAQRNFNYWRTTTTELVALSPKVPFVGAVGQFDTDADKWARANTDSLPFIEYDPVEGAPPPMRQSFAGVPAGPMQEALNASDDIKTIVGMFNASLGERSNETSGVAINARKKEGDTGTYHFVDNQARAIKHTGRIIIDLVPPVYPKARIIRIMGIDKAPSNVPVNQQLQPGQMPDDEDGMAQIFDLTVGKYDLTVDVGPGFQTKREEAVFGMTELMRAFPPAAAVIGPHLAKAQDWDGAEEIGEELAALSPNAQQNNPQAQQMHQQMQQMQQQLQQTTQQLQAAQADKSLDAQKLQIDQFNAETNRMKAMKEMQPAAPDAPDTALPEAQKIAIEHHNDLEKEALKIEGQKQLEILRQQGVPPTPEQMEEQAMSSQVMQQLLVEVGGLKQMVTAPRRRTIITDPMTGKAIGAHDEIVMPEPQEQEAEQ